MNEKTCIHCEKEVETEKVYHKKDLETYFDRCTECGEPVSDKDGVIKALMLENTHSEKRTNLVIFAGVTVFVIISLIREFF
jgi:NAD-dependent SIR2 family protein deacetylase